MTDCEVNLTSQDALQFMKKKIFLGALVLGLALTGINQVLAYGGQGSDFGRGQGRGQGRGSMINSEQHQVMLDTINQGDYQAWLKLMGDKPMTQKITEANFPRFVEMHKLMQAGKQDEANKIRQELGLGQGQMKGHGACGLKRGNI